jgi:hypothetical protein
MKNFIALYRGESLEDTRLVTLTTDSVVVRNVAERMLSQQEPTIDPALAATQDGVTQALELILNETQKAN